MRTRTRKLHFTRIEERERESFGGVHNNEKEHVPTVNQEKDTDLHVNGGRRRQDFRLGTYTHGSIKAPGVLAPTRRALSLPLAFRVCFFQFTFLHRPEQ